MADVINFVDRALAPKPDLIIHASDLPATAEALRDLLAASGKLFDRGVPVRIIKPADGGPPSATRLTSGRGSTIKRSPGHSRRPRAHFHPPRARALPVVGYVSLNQQGIDTTTPAGKAMFQMMGVFAEFERAMIAERVRAGMARAKSQGKHCGRPKIAPATERAVRASLAKGKGICSRPEITVLVLPQFIKAEMA